MGIFLHRTLVLQRIDDAATVDDILQDIFVKIHTRLDLLKEKEKLRSWLYQVSRNAVIDHYQSAKPSETLPDRLSDTEADFGERVKQELSQCLFPMIERLPPLYRDAVMLSEIKALTQKDLSRAQGISLSAAKSRVQRDRAQLKAMLQACCQIELDRTGRVVDYQRKSDSYKVC